MRTIKMNDKTYESIANMNRVYGSSLLYSFQCRTIIEGKLQSAEGESKERLQKELYNLNEKIKSTAEGRRLFTYALQEENQKRAEAAREAPKPKPIETPVLEEMVLVA